MPLKIYDLAAYAFKVQIETELILMRCYFFPVKCDQGHQLAKFYGCYGLESFSDKIENLSMTFTPDGKR